MWWRFCPKEEKISEIKNIDKFDHNYGWEGGVGGENKLDQWFSWPPKPIHVMMVL